MDRDRVDEPRRCARRRSSRLAGVAWVVGCAADRRRLDGAAELPVEWHGLVGDWRRDTDPPVRVGDRLRCGTATCRPIWWNGQHESRAGRHLDLERLGMDASVTCATV